MITASSFFKKIEKIDKFASMDIIQKTNVKWDIEGDENSLNSSHGLINQKRANSNDQWDFHRINLEEIMESRLGIVEVVKASEARMVTLLRCGRSIEALFRWIYMILLTYSFASCVMPMGVKGDPLSSFPFHPLVMEVYIMLLREAMGNEMDNNHSCSPLVFYLASGLKINIHKSNIYGIGVNKDEVLSMASNAGCMAGDIPFNYLGLPIGSNMKSIASWKTLVDRFHMRLSSWKANLSVIGVSSLTSYQLSTLALLKKWRWRLLSSPLTPFGFRSSKLIMVKKEVSIQMVVASRAFGLTLLEPPIFSTRKARLLFLQGTIGSIILINDKDCLIIDRINNGQWSWNWSRTNLGVRNLAYLCDMLNEIGQLNIDVNEDTCTWSLGPNGTFTVKDARYRIDQNILPTLAHATTWDKSIPRKSMLFMWRLSLDRLPHRLNLSSRGMDISAISCPSCNANVESANHVFFECDIATDMWKLVFKMV
ncbi:RNA-directed DNA polymerase, eukaryota, reverse transcriptase zinc-binding domain protein [Tanacetum coccineum]